MLLAGLSASQTFSTKVVLGFFAFSRIAWEDYTSWQSEDKKILKKINSLIKEFQRSPHEGIGKPEPLKFDLAGLWSRRIDLKHRLVFKIENDDLLIYACRYQRFIGKAQVREAY